MSSVYTQIEKCRRLIAQSLNAPDASLWNTEDFEKLSDRIFEKTGVRLSVSTLKRIWGKVNYNSSPSMATLNTLARFLDYDNWRDFEQKNPGGDPSAESVPAAISASPRTTRKFLRPALFGTVVILIAGFVLSGFFLSGRKQAPDTAHPPNPKSPAPGSSTVKFESRTTSDDLPNSVVFDYDASGLGADSVYIQQSWDPTRKEKVPATAAQHTSLYYYPGYFDAKLVVNGEVQKHSPVFIKTKGWKGIIETRPVPVYLTTAEIAGRGSLGIGETTLRQKTGSSVFTGTWVDFLNIRAFDGLDAGDFTMTATLRNTSTVEQSLCRKIRVTIVGKQSAIIIPLAARGCIADLQLLAGDHMISGKDRDLSAFGCDFRRLQRISCQVQNSHMQISLNGVRILDTPQAKTIGDIVGLSIAFEGTGEIKTVSLSSPGKPGYQEKF